ncbi:MAG: PD-(D/E)XK nuclease family protein [Bryobacteraceae bacterium]|jgi:CRISPR/Cas system-associated exonuclease Cas4 (RecB family)
MTASVVDTALGELLSPSQVNTFLSCAAKWYFRYALGLREPATGALALGTAFHSALAANFRQKIETKQDLPSETLQESFSEAFAIAAEDAEFREDEEPTALIESGQLLVAKYMADAAPAVQPKAVELPVEGTIAGVRVQGFVDLLDVEGRIIDCKTATRRPAGITPEYNLQLTTYSMITPGAIGLCRLDTVTKTTTVQLVQHSCQIGPEERRYAETIYPMAQEAMRDGIYVPRRSSPFCSRRYCGYWRECEREYGGRVSE